jgi:3-hydroxyisobutyrate dehydrogenase-like beta-hydroxyacid dehydrogenase
MTTDRRVGLVGLGRMGGPIARHLGQAGWQVTGVDTSPEARDRAGAVGLAVAGSVAALAGLPVVFSSLPDGPQVAEVYTELSELLAPGSLAVDLSTISVALSRELAATARAAGITFLDAPVSGTSLHAEAGTLTVMVGGDHDGYQRAAPYLAAFANSTHYLGESGSGLTVKLISNRLLTSNLVALAEALVEIEASGLDLYACLEALRAGAVPRLLDYKAEPMALRDFTPRFTIDLMSKDLGLATELFTPGPIAALAAQILQQTRKEGHGPDDIGAVIETVSRDRKH